MCNYGLLCGETVRNVKLPDLLCVPMDTKGPTTCNAMVIITGSTINVSKLSALTYGLAQVGVTHVMVFMTKTKGKQYQKDT